MTDARKIGSQILLVEDNADEEILMLEALNRCGMQAQVIVAHDGAEALEYLLPKCDPLVEIAVPKLIVLDLKLPKVSGLDVLRRVRREARTQFVPVVVLTSSSEKQDIHDSYANGANAYVCKSIDFDEFLEAVRCLERFWRVFNHTVS